MLRLTSLVFGLCVALLAMRAGAAPQRERSAPAPAPAGDAEKQFVEKTLGAVSEFDPAAAARAEEALVQQGEKVVPALRELAPRYRGAAREAADHALLRLKWGTDPRRVLTEWLRENVKGGQAGRPTLVYTEALERVFPDRVFYSLWVNAFPVARMAPEPLAMDNLFMVGRDGKVTHLKSVDELKSALKEAPKPARVNENSARDLLEAYLRLTQEYSRSGMFTLAIAPESIKVEKTSTGWTASGKNVVTSRGDKGEITATMTINGDGTVTNVDEKRDLKAGIRPICQVTKLLDPDPIVRQMAEQDLLFMGGSARLYIEEQRAKASPELRQAIDRMWKRMCQEDERR